MWRSKHQDPFDKLLSQGHSCAWEEDWMGAVEVYGQAARLRPQDPLVHMNLGLTYLRLGRFQEALDHYLKADNLSAGDPVAKTKVAELYQRLGQGDQAAQAYLALAELHRGGNALRQAIAAWQAAVELSPDLIEARRHLAAAFQELGQTGRAVEELLHLTRLHQARGETGQAVALCRQALELDPHSAHARQVEEALRRGTAVQADTVVEETVGAGQADDDEGDSLLTEATHRAITQLAEQVFQQSSPDDGSAATSARADVGALIAKALSYQKQGLAEEAIRCYEQTISAGHQPPEVLFSLGRLYQEALRLEEAVAFLSRTVDGPDFAMASHFALGQCFQLQGNLDQALDHFLEAVKIVDLATVRSRARADDLIQLYERLAESYAAKGDTEKAGAFAKALANFLSRRGWEDKAREARQRIQILPSAGSTFSLAELLESPGADEVLQALSTSQELASQGLFVAATDVCFWVLSKAPGHLPLHHQLAEILIAQDRLGEAVAKFLVIAEVYTARGHLGKAVATCKRALQAVPTSTKLHARLIDLSVRQGEIDQALEHYLSLADTYYRLADVDRAIETYQEALRLTPRGSPEKEWDVQIQRRLADTYRQRLDWPRAVEAYESILAHHPDDADIQRQLLDLYTRMGRNVEARATVDALADLYQQRGELNSAIELLEEQAENAPNDRALRLRLGEICVQAGRKGRAIDAWSQVLRLQLADGQKAQASATVRRIIVLSPPNVSAYKKLLSSLGTS